MEKFVKGSGSGGQKINKTSSCVFLKHLPTGVCIKCQMDRSREMNRYLAKRELCEQLEAIREGRAMVDAAVKDEDGKVVRYVPGAPLRAMRSRIWSAVAGLGYIFVDYLKNRGLNL